MRILFYILPSDGSSCMNEAEMDISSTSKVRHRYKLISYIKILYIVTIARYRVIVELSCNYRQVSFNAPFKTSSLPGSKNTEEK